jgi:RNA polymerase sigma-70 factor (ECF subfamily)
MLAGGVLWHDVRISRLGCGMDQFQTTRWSLVLEARAGEARSRKALEALCKIYRSPVVAFIRRTGAGPQDAEDLAQTFFARFVERAFHAQADPARGRFRAFLLTALKNFLADSAAEAHAIKRGGNIQFQSFDSATFSLSSTEGSTEQLTPDQEFDRAWAQAMLQSAHRKLRNDATTAGKSALFEALSEFLTERPDEADYIRVAARLGIRRNTLAVAVHRLRNRLRELVCRELSDTAAVGADREVELDQLRNSLGGLLD